MKLSTEWKNFIICLLFGWLGIHKFREKKIGLGILYFFTFGLFFIGWIIDVIAYLSAAIKGRDLTENITSYNSLHTVTSNLMLKPGEKCYYSSPATYVKTKNVVVGYTGGSRGTSIRVMKGMSIRVGASKSAPVRGDVSERTPGILSITNQRVVFSGNKGSFDKKFSSISAVTPYKDGITFQFGDKQCPLELKDVDYAYNILAQAVNSESNEDDCNAGI